MYYIITYWYYQDGAKKVESIDYHIACDSISLQDIKNMAYDHIDGNRELSFFITKQEILYKL